jgi:hypothetical protein
MFWGRGWSGRRALSVSPPAARDGMLSGTTASFFPEFDMSRFHVQRLW